MNKFYTLIIFLFIAQLSVGQNDLCENAIVLTPSSSCVFTNGTFNGATNSSPAPSCGVNSIQDVWYKFVATEKTISVFISATAGLNHGFEIIEGSCSGTSLRCINFAQAGNSESYSNNNYVIGETYYVRVLNVFGNLSTASFSICVQAFPPPGNDLCANATTLTGGSSCVPTNGTFSGSTISTPTASCGSNAIQDVWYKFVATDPTMSVFVSATAGLNHGFEVLKNSCDGLSLRCVNFNPAGNSESQINNDYIVGETYYVRVLNVGGGISLANFNICVQSFPTPANDLCENAISLTPSSSCVATSGTFSGSSIAPNATACGATVQQDVWYKFVATDPTMSVFLSATSGLNHGFEIFKGSCDGTSLQCVNFNPANNSESLLENYYIVGETYYVRVINFGGGVSLANFTICIQAFPSPSNDVCSNAIILTPRSSCVSTNVTFSGSSINPSAPACGATIRQDVWYQFVATESTMSIFLSATSGLNHGFELYKGSCTSASILCVNSNPANNSESNMNNNYVVGETYFVRVLNLNGNLSLATFNICVQAFPPPINDLCANATSLTITTNCQTVPATFNGSGSAGLSPICGSNSIQDVWYKFVAPMSEITVRLAAASGVNHGMELYEGNCSGTVLSCVNAAVTGSLESATYSSLIVGVTYYIRIFNANQGLSLGAFGICAFNTMLSSHEATIAEVLMYPNPVATSLYFDGLAINQGKYFIYNQIGQKIEDAKLLQNEINVSGLSSGIYFIKITDSKGVIRLTKKFIKL